MTEDKFREIYQQYYRLVKSVVYSILKDVDFSEDVCQEVFLLFSEKAETLNEDYYRQWFTVNARRKAIDFCRKSYQVHEVTTEALSRENELLREEVGRWSSQYNGDSFEDGMAHRLALQELTGKLFEDLAEKNSLWYEIVMRVYVEGEDIEEVARALGISTENLRTKKHRIKIWIKENYGKEFEGF